MIHRSEQHGELTWEKSREKIHLSMISTPGSRKQCLIKLLERTNLLRVNALTISFIHLTQPGTATRLLIVLILVVTSTVVAALELKFQKEKLIKRLTSSLKNKERRVVTACQNGRLTILRVKMKSTK